MTVLTVIVNVLFMFGGYQLMRFAMPRIINSAARQQKICGLCFKGQGAYLFDEKKGHPFWVCDSCCDQKLGHLSKRLMLSAGSLIPKDEVQP
jgi:hypothetical protein